MDQAEVDALVERYGNAWLIWHDRSSVWWRPERHGYTTSVLEAGIYTRKQVLSQVRERVEDRPVSLLSVLARRHDPGCVGEALGLNTPSREACEAAAERVKITDEEWAAVNEVHARHLREAERLQLEYDKKRMHEALSFSPFDDHDEHVSKRLRDEIVVAAKRHECDGWRNDDCDMHIDAGEPHRVMVVRDHHVKGTVLQYRWCKACTLRLLDVPGAEHIGAPRIRRVA